MGSLLNALMNDETKLSEIIPVLENEISRFTKTLIGVMAYSRRSKKRSYNSLLNENYYNVLLVLKRILDDLKESQKVIKQIFDPNRDKSKIIIEAERVELVNKHSIILSYLRIDIKILYIFTAQIFDIFRKSRANIDLKELERISLFRHKLITHIHETSFFDSSITTQGGTRFHLENESIDVLYSPLLWSKSRFTGLGKIVKKTTPFIPELEDEENVFERIGILYRHINKIIDKKLRKDVIEFIFKIGLTTENPNIIALALLQALKEHRRNRYSIPK